MPGRDDLVVERLELAHDATVQHDGRAARGAGERERAAEATGGAGDEDCAPGEIGQVGSAGRRERHGIRQRSGAMIARSAMIARVVANRRAPFAKAQVRPV